MDSKCARLYKPKWFNEKITQPNRDMFGFTKHDERVRQILRDIMLERCLMAKRSLKSN